MSALEDLLHEVDDPSGISWKDEMYDVLRAQNLKGAERTTYVERLIANARKGDTRAILSLGALNASEAQPMLEAEARGSESWAPTARRALVLMGQGAQVLDAIIGDALHAPAKMARVAAVLDLAKLSSPKAIDALEQALDDREYEIRLFAWDGLIDALDLKRHLVDAEGIRQLSTDIERMRILLGCEKVYAFRKLGADGMRDFTKRVRAGASPQSLGIQYAPREQPELFQKLRLALIDDAEPFPLDELAGLHDFARRQAETIIAMRLEEADMRAPEALVQLGAEWTAPGLDECAANGDMPDAFRQLCGQCARALRGS